MVVSTTKKDVSLSMVALVTIIIAMLLAVTAPITSMLLTRAALFRGRRSAARRTLPPALHPKAAAEVAAAPASEAEVEAAPTQQDAAEAASSENTSDQIA